MQLALNTPKYDLTAQSLKLFEILGPDRMEQYCLNKFPLELVYKFYNHQLRGPFNLVGYEFNTILKKYLQQLDAKNIQMEVLIDTRYGHTELDAVCELNEEYHSWEAKCQKKLNDKCVLQIKKASGQYKNCHVLVPKDTLIDSKIGKRIEKAGGDIIRANIKRNDVIYRVMNIRVP